MKSFFRDAMPTETPLAGRRAAFVGPPPRQTFAAQIPEQLRLIAFDTEDLKVISANVQDSLVRVGEMAYLPKTKQFVIVAARFDWVRAAEGVWERCRTGLQFKRVLKASCAGFAQRDKAAILNLLSICYRETSSPAGEIHLIFSGGCGLRLDVECLEAELRDFDLRWKAKALPGHHLEDWPEPPPGGLAGT
jgi:hypothetical protein